MALPLPSAVFTRFPAFARYRAASGFLLQDPRVAQGGLGGGAALPSYLVIDLAKNRTRVGVHGSAAAFALAQSPARKALLLRKFNRTIKRCWRIYN